MEEEEVEDEGEDGSLAYSPPVPEDLLVITADLPLIGEFLGPPGLHLRRYFRRQDVTGSLKRRQKKTSKGQKILDISLDHLLKTRWHSLKQDLSSILAYTRFPFSKINLCKHFMVTLCAYIVLGSYWVNSCWCMNMFLGVARSVEKVTRYGRTFLKPGTAISIGPTLQRQMYRKNVLKNGVRKNDWTLRQYVNVM